MGYQVGILCRYERAEFAHKPCVRLLSGVPLIRQEDVHLLEIRLRERAIIALIVRRIEKIRDNRLSLFANFI